MSVEITEEMIAAFNNADFTGCGNADWEDSHLRVGLAAVFALPEVRQALGDDDRAGEVLRRVDFLVRSTGDPAYSIQTMAREYGVTL